MSHPQTPTEGLRTGQSSLSSMPDFGDDEQFIEVVRRLSVYFVDIIETKHSFEQLRTVSNILQPLIEKLSITCHHPLTVSALMILKWHFSSLEPDDQGINETRGYACEIIAWRFLTHKSEHELIDYLLSELPPRPASATRSSSGNRSRSEGGHNASLQDVDSVDEHSELLSDRPSRIPKRPRLPEGSLHHRSYRTVGEIEQKPEDDVTSSFVGLNALEIAAVADAKKFLSQRIVQKIVDGIWCGDIVFWEALSVHATKKAQLYNKRRADPYSRLRVPKYQKVFEALFFASFLALYYAVLVERNPRHITPTEVLLYIWITAFAYDEFGEFRDAGTLFYAQDFWSIWDLGIIGVGAAYLVASFLTTFTLLARDHFTLRQMSWVLIKVFFGSSYLGFDIASEVMDHAREEYLFQYSVFVLEASASRRLTFYLPPLNLIPLICFRPLRLCIPSEQLRSARIVLLKVTHIPYVAAIWAYEGGHKYVSKKNGRCQYTSKLRKEPILAGSHGHPGSSRKVSGFPALTGRSEASLVRSPAVLARPKATGNNGDAVLELKQMIEKLSAQVEELASRLPRDDDTHAS
ncbi:hypothetical protein LPUS_11008 [Lasallia pustulata]|uniref:Calcium channel YVC1-like C-terminal transmembrane domain-containing protein n=1 Tax=Lasallia pustulata TaxID=136370 RepID=A0A1W5DB32_9LECA|nr:hypothetical protein LPUS_11008 [Lasallia pustulata]